MSSVIFETDHLLVSQSERSESNIVFVTFNEMGFKPDGARFWGDMFFAKSPFAAIGVVSKRPNWYPAAEMRAAAERIRAATPGACRITYGLSQGGDGALKFAAALDARGALSFGPQWSIDPDDVGDFDKRYLQYFARGLGNGARVLAKDVKPNSFMFYDPYLRVDALNAARLRELPGIEATPCPFAGHAPLQLLVEARLSAPFIETAAAAISSDRPSAETRNALRALLRQARGRSRTYKEKRVQTLRSNKKVDLLAAIERRAPETLPPAMALSLAVKRKDAAAVARLVPSMGMKDISSAGASVVWQFVRAEGLREAELRLAELVLREGPTTLLQLHAVNSLVRLDLLQLARLALADVVAKLGVTKKDEAELILNLARRLGIAEIERRATEFLATA